MLFCAELSGRDQLNSIEKYPDALRLINKQTPFPLVLEKLPGYLSAFLPLLILSNWSPRNPPDDDDVDQCHGAVTLVKIRSFSRTRTTPNHS